MKVEEIVESAANLRHDDTESVKPQIIPYNFPGLDHPFDHQIVTFDFIVNTLSCFVFNSIGTGKTFSAVWAMDYLMRIGEIKKVLIVAPLSTLDVVWMRTLFTLDQTLTVSVLKGKAEKKVDTMYLNTFDGRHVCIVNPDSLHILAKEKSWLKDFQMLIVDESAMFRNQSSRRGKALKEIAAKVSRKLFMTGSPTPEAITDLWFTARIICPERVPKYFGQFRDLTMKKVSQFKWVELPDAQAKVSAMLKGYVIRFERDECLDLPPTQSINLETTLSKQQEKLLAQIRDEAAISLENGSIVAGNEAVVINKMLQICSGAVKYSTDDGHNSQVLDVDCKSKFEALADLLEATNHPIIIYSDFTAVINNISDWLGEKKIEHHKIDGNNSTAQRLEAFDAIQNRKVKVLVAHPRAMAHGITLTESNMILWWSPIFSQEIYEQANGRITRPGQVNKTFIGHLISSALERRVLKRLQTKQELQGVLLEFLKYGEGNHDGI